MSSSLFIKIGSPYFTACFVIFYQGLGKIEETSQLSGDSLLIALYSIIVSVEEWKI